MTNFVLRTVFMESFWDRNGEVNCALGDGGRRLYWGGDFKTILDRPHVQWTAGNTLAQMRSSVKKVKATC